MKILILHDQVPARARPDEADALVQAHTVQSALDALGHDATSLGASLDLERVASDIERIRPDLVFNLVESLRGAGRLIHLVPSLLESMGIPYTGAPAEAVFCTSNKLLAKRMLRGAYLPTPEWFTMADLANADEIQFDRYIVKSVWEHASIGLDEDSVIAADSPWQLREAIENRLDRLGGEGFAERYIDGREFNLSMLGGEFGPQVLPPAEIMFDGYRAGKPRVVGYRAKWDDQSYEYHHTPPMHEFAQHDGPLLERLSALAIDCWRLFNLRGYARVDFRVSESAQGTGGTPWILEINTNPCVSPDAGFAAALNQAEIPLTHAIDRIIQDSMSSRKACDRSTHEAEVIRDVQQQ